MNLRTLWSGSTENMGKGHSPETKVADMMLCQDNTEETETGSFKSKILFWRLFKYEDEELWE